MTTEKLIQLANLYLGFVTLPDSVPRRVDPASVWSDLPFEKIFGHLAWMCEHIIKNAKSEPEKMQRWLGFVQGVLCSKGTFTIEQLRSHNSEEMSIP